MVRGTSFKIDLQDYLEWLILQAKSSGQNSPQYGSHQRYFRVENYDAIIIAVGAKPQFNLPGIDKPHVHWAPDAELNSKCL